METKKCPYCGGEIKAVAKKCKHCGKWIEQQEGGTEAQPASFESFTSVNWKIIVVCIVILIIVLCVLFSSANKAPNVSNKTKEEPTELSIPDDYYDMPQDDSYSPSQSNEDDDFVIN